MNHWAPILIIYWWLAYCFSSLHLYVREVCSEIHSWIMWWHVCVHENPVQCRHLSVQYMYVHNVGKHHKRLVFCDFWQGGEVTIPIDEDVLEIIVTFQPIDSYAQTSTYLTVKGCFEESRSLYNLWYTDIQILYYFLLQCPVHWVGKSWNGIIMLSIHYNWQLSLKLWHSVFQIYFGSMIVTAGGKQHPQ